MKLLAIDGGGIRGLIPALVLAEIEHRTGRPLASLVDVIAGTSTGAIIACALAKPQAMPAARVAEIYEQDGPKIFDASLLRSDRDDISMVDAAHASSAAPTYFEPLRVGDRTYVDGGVGAINPSLHAYAETAGKPSLLLSLGTGSQTRPLPYDKVKDWGKLEWAAPILDVVFDATADAVDSQLARLIDGHYIRLQTRLTEASDALDDASADNLAALRREAEKLIAARSADIDRACALLTA